MSDDDALGPDMHPLLGFLEPTPPAAGQDTLERLLDGRLDPAEAPAGYGELASLLAAATAPAHAGGARWRAGGAGRVPGSDAVASPHPRPPEGTHAQQALHGQGGRGRTGRGPVHRRGRRCGNRAVARPGAAGGRPGTLHDRGQRGRPRPGRIAPSPTSTRPPRGCAGPGRPARAPTTVARADAPAFQTLAAAAGGANKVAGYCADVTAGVAQGPRSARGRRRLGRTPRQRPGRGLCRAWQAGKGTDNGRRTRLGGIPGPGRRGWRDRQDRRLLR